MQFSFPPTSRAPVMTDANGDVEMRTEENSDKAVAKTPVSLSNSNNPAAQDVQPKEVGADQSMAEEAPQKDVTVLESGSNDVEGATTTTTSTSSSSQFCASTVPQPIPNTHPFNEPHSEERQEQQPSESGSSSSKTPMDCDGPAVASSTQAKPIESVSDSAPASGEEQVQRAAKVEQLRQLGNAEFRAHRFAKAIDFFTEALALDPSNHLIRGNRAAAYIELKQWDCALEDANQCIELNPNWSRGYLRRGAALVGAGLYDAAAEAFEKAFADDKSNPDYAARLQALEQAREKYQKFREAAKQAFTKKRFDEALGWYDKAIEHAPQDKIMYSNRSACYTMLKKYRKALTDAAEAIALDPEWAKAWRRKGSALHGLRLFHKSVEAYNRALALGDENPEDLRKAIERVKDDWRKTQLVLLCSDECGYHYLEDIDEPNLMCPICYRPFIAPVLTPCGHTFCCHCITESLRRVNARCPFCVRSMEDKELKPANQDLIDQLDSLMVCCPHGEKYGCNFVGPRGSLESHLLNECEHEAEFQSDEAERRSKSLLRGIKLYVGNTYRDQGAHYELNARHQWTMYVRTDADIPTETIAKVVFHLPSPFYPGSEVVEITEAPFQVSRVGWGVFSCPIEIHFKNGQVVRTEHYLCFDSSMTEELHEITYTPPFPEQ